MLLKRHTAPVQIFASFYNSQRPVPRCMFETACLTFWPRFSAALAKTSPPPPPLDGVERSRLADARPLLQRQRGLRKRRSTGNPPAIAVSPSFSYHLSRGPSSTPCGGEASARGGGKIGSSGSDSKGARLGGAGPVGVGGAFRGLPADGDAGSVRSGP